MALSPQIQVGLALVLVVVGACGERERDVGEGEGDVGEGEGDVGEGEGDVGEGEGDVGEGEGDVGEGEGDVGEGEGDVGEGEGDVGEGEGEGVVDPFVLDDGPEPPGLRTVEVSTSQDLLDAIANAQPGDDIILADGVYVISENITPRVAGTPEAPMFVRAENPLLATLSMCSTEGFRMFEPHWTFLDLTIEGACPNQDDGSNEHAFHIVGRANFTVLRGNHIKNFKSAVKLNAAEDPFVWPDHATFVNNVFRYTEVIGGEVPHNQLNIDGGDFHLVRGNRFVDLVAEPLAARHASSIYLKMASRDFVVEQNLVVCEKHITNSATRRGIFAGDAGADSPFCDGACANQRGLYRNNIVINCNGGGNTGGIFLGNEQETTYTHHTVHNVKQNYFSDAAPGITVSFYGNLLAKSFVLGGAADLTADIDNTYQADSELDLFVEGDRADFTAAAAIPTTSRRSDTPRDFCGNARAETTSQGAIAYEHQNASLCVQTIRSAYEEL
jgi:hypothetical protein